MIHGHKFIQTTSHGVHVWWLWKSTNTRVLSIQMTSEQIWIWICVCTETTTNTQYSNSTNKFQEMTIRCWFPVVVTKVGIIPISLRISSFFLSPSTTTTNCASCGQRLQHQQQDTHSHTRRAINHQSPQKKLLKELAMCLRGRLCVHWVEFDFACDLHWYETLSYHTYSRPGWYWLDQQIRSTFPYKQTTQLTPSAHKNSELGRTHSATGVFLLFDEVV